MNRPTRKRAATETQDEASRRVAKRAKTHSIPEILTQTSEKALNSKGELDVEAFIKGREFEIRALQDNMTATKKSSATRAFQSVPRELRRRTASHNVKRVPKRLRSRAAKEVCDVGPAILSMWMLIVFAGR